jgi:hypothetical protein
MAADSSDKLRKYARKWVGQIGSGGVADADVTTIPLASASNLPTDTAVDVVINRVDANGVKTPSSEETVTGVVSGNNLVDCIRGVEGTAQAHDAGSVAEVLVTAARENDMVDWGLVEHAQDGTHATATVTTLKATGAEINTGTEDGKIVTPKAIADSKVLRSNEAWDGWLETGETWEYASENTITVPTDATAKYQKGDKIRLKQGGDYKYFYVVGVAATVLTVTGGDDYTVAEAAITDNYYSKSENPQGFPHWFSYTPSLVGFSSDPTIHARFCIRSVAVSLRLRLMNGTSNATGLTASLPVTAKTISGIEWTQETRVKDNNTFTNGFVAIGSGGSVATFYKTVAGGAFTASGSKSGECSLVYEI